MNQQTWDLLLAKLDRMDEKLDQINGKVQRHERDISFVKRTIVWVSGLAAFLSLAVVRWAGIVKGWF